MTKTKEKRVGIANAIWVRRALNQIRHEHDEWMRTAQLGTPYWTVSPIYPAQPDKAWTYDIHGGPYVFTKNWSFGMHGLGCNGSSSWVLWRQHGPLTPVPQQTSTSWNERHAAGHAAEMQRMARTVDAAIIAELRRRYPESTRALASV